MTREEAIELLRTIEVCSFKDKSKKYFLKDVVEALDIAIECLQSSEMWNGTTTDKRIFAPKGTFQKVFEDGKAEPCEDCISRTKLLARIDAERKHLLDIKMDGAEHIVVHHARRIIEDLPSVTPTRPTGEWISTHNKEEWCAYEKKCSICGNLTLDYGNYCSSCGADMRRGDADADSD